MAAPGSSKRTGDNPGRGADRQREVEQLRRELSAVYRISAALSSHLEVDDVVQEALKVSLETVDAAAGTIYLHDPQAGRLVFKYVVGERAKELTGMTIRTDQGISGDVFQSGIPRLTEDVRKDPHYLSEVGEKVDYATRNMITVPMKNSEGRAIGVLQALNKTHNSFTAQDMDLLTTVASQAAVAIENALLHRQARLATVAHLLGDISHDVKNFLTPVVTGVQALEMELKSFFAEFENIVERRRQDDPELIAQLEQTAKFLKGFYPEIVEMVEEGADEVQDMVRQIADCVKGIVAQPRFEPSDINEIVRRVVGTLRLTAERHQVTLALGHLELMPATLADERRVFSALYNLVNNAIPETPPGGRVGISTSAVLEGTWPEGGYIGIEVADTGKGMPPEVRDRLFTDDAVSTKAGGTGLGTRIVKNVVDLHQGTISVKSREGVGTTFFIKLPIRAT